MGKKRRPAIFSVFFGTKVAKWQIPDDVIFLDELPHTATGKIQKTALRARFKDHVWT